MTSYTPNPCTEGKIGVNIPQYNNSDIHIITVKIVAVGGANNDIENHFLVFYQAGENNIKLIQANDFNAAINTNQCINNYVSLLLAGTTPDIGDSAIASSHIKPCTETNWDDVIETRFTPDGKVSIIFGCANKPNITQHDRIDFFLVEFLGQYHLQPTFHVDMKGDGEGVLINDARLYTGVWKYRRTFWDGLLNFKHGIIHDYYDGRAAKDEYIETDPELLSITSDADHDAILNYDNENIPDNINNLRLVIYQEDVDGNIPEMATAEIEPEDGTNSYAIPQEILNGNPFEMSIQYETETGQNVVGQTFHTNGGGDADIIALQYRQGYVEDPNDSALLSYNVYDNYLPRLPELSKGRPGGPVKNSGDL